MLGVTYRAQSGLTLPDSRHGPHTTIQGKCHGPHTPTGYLSYLGGIPIKRRCLRAPTHVPIPPVSKSELLLLREFRDATSGRIVFEPEASYSGFVGMCVNKYE